MKVPDLEQPPTELTENKREINKLKALIFVIIGVLVFITNVIWIDETVFYFAAILCAIYGLFIRVK